MLTVYFITYAIIFIVMRFNSVINVNTHLFFIMLFLFLEHLDLDGKFDALYIRMGLKKKT